MKKIFLFIILIISIDLTAQCVYEWGTTSSLKVERSICKDRSGNIITVYSSGGGDYLKKYTSAGVPIFTKGYYGDNGIITWDCTTDNNDNIYLTGTYEGTLHIGAVTLSEAYDVCYQAFVMKFSPTGTLLWVKRSSGNYGSSADGDEVGYEVTADDSGNCYLAGIYSSNFIFGAFDLSGTGSNNFISKLDGATGNVLWVKAYNDYGNVLYAPKTKAKKNGEFFQVANYRFTVNVDSTTSHPAHINWNDNIYAALYETNGNLKWSIVSIGQGTIQAAAMDSHENILITGTMIDSLAFGTQKIYSLFEKGIFFAKIDTLGNVLQLERIGACTDITADVRVAKYGLDVDSLDNVYISGRALKDVNFNGLMTTQVVSDGQHSFVTKYDNLLTPIWYNTYQASTNSYGFNVGVVKLENKNVYASGYFYDNIVIDSVSFSYGTNDFYEYIAEMCDQNGHFEVPVGVYESKFQTIHIYPNPVQDEIHFFLDDGNLEEYEIFVSNVLGEQQKIVVKNSSIITSQFAPGVYFIKALKGDTQLSAKFVKE